jgi:signal transduction histidine kinase
MNQRRFAWTIWGFSTTFVIAYVAVDASVPHDDSDLSEYAFTVGAVVLYATVGALITSRQLGNRIGLLFSWVAASAAASLVAGAYASLAFERDLPLVVPGAWVGRVGSAAMIGPLAFLFLIFPTGEPPSRRWGWLLRLMLVAYAVTIVLFALTPGPLRAGFAEIPRTVQNPIGLPASWQGAIEASTTVCGFVVFGGAIFSVLSLVQRYRRASATERQQIRWLAFLGMFIGAYVLLVFIASVTGLVPENSSVANISFFVMIFAVFLGIPITCAVAILKYGLWDLDVVVKKTVQYSVLLVASLAVIGILLTIPWLLAIGIPREILPGVAIGLVVAAVFSVLRPRAQRFANRVVYGKRSTPYEVLSEFSERVGETYSTEDVLPRMAQLLGEATGARVARVWLRVGGAMRSEASWPSEAPAVGDVPVAGDELPPFGDDRAFEVRHQGDLLGALIVTEAADDPITAPKEKLARDMAAQAGLVLRNVRLIEDLRESRRRIVSAQDERARALERNIHDGAQQQLVALSVKLRLAEGLAERDPSKVRALLGELQGQTNETLEDLRDLARGIYPPLLADRGLPAALESQARKSPVPVRIQPDGLSRYRPDVESAVYFCCLEALNNVAKYADASSVEIRLAQVDGELRFEVIDDGRGFDASGTTHGTGLQGMADRLEAIGGSLEVRSAPDRGTTISGTVPAGTARGPGA